MQSHAQVSTPCTKGFPKVFQDLTVVQKDAYLLICQRNTGDIYIGRNGFVYNNHWVVPYNSYLS